MKYLLRIILFPPPKRVDVHVGEKGTAESLIFLEVLRHVTTPNIFINYVDTEGIPSVTVDDSYSPQVGLLSCSRYLCRLTGTYPHSPEKALIVDSFLEDYPLLLRDLQESQSSLEETRDADGLAEEHKMPPNHKIFSLLDKMETRLQTETNVWISSESFSFVDILCLGILKYTELLFPSMKEEVIASKYPLVMDWWDTCSERRRSGGHSPVS